MSGLYWIPHLTEVWAVARSSDSTHYILEDPVDSSTTEAVGTIIELSSSNIKSIVTSLKDVSEICLKASISNNYDYVVMPITDAAGLEGPDNICDLADVHEASILHSLRKRYLNDLIYSNVGRIVIAMNPFMEIKGLYGTTVANKFLKSDNPYRLPPHVYQVAAAAVQKLGESGIPQSSIITGESGAGKTESTKLILQFLANAGGKSTSETLMNASSGITEQKSNKQFVSKKTTRLDGKGRKEGRESFSIEDRILRVNPLLEAFGNATTSRNPNSSRFGKWIEVHFDDSMNVIGATITSYLLELPRVTRHIGGERGYHVFYQLLTALESDLAVMAEKYVLQPGSPPADDIYRFLTADTSESGSVPTLPINDSDGFRELRSSMASLQFEPIEQDYLFSIVASLLHLGNLEFVSKDSSTEAATAADHLRHHLEVSSRLLQIDGETVDKCMTFREVKTGAEVIQVPLKQHEAEAARDGLAKLIYGCVFDWIIYRANNKLKPIEIFGRFVGILDIAGFEAFAVNGFEQLCINLSNEKLQNHFNYDIFQSELTAYAEEGLEGLDVGFEDNKKILELIEGKGALTGPWNIICVTRSGIIATLDEELFVPRGSDKGFVQKIVKAQEKHPNFSKSRTHADEKFTIRHFAGDVIYTAKGWLEKNQYSPPKLALEALRSSQNPVIQQMVSPEVSDKFKSDQDGKGAATKKVTVGSTFRKQLVELMEKIKSTEVHYVRCIKPNKRLQPHQIDSSEILHQLRSSGAMEAVKIRKAGFPVRVPIDTFISRFGIMMGKRASTLKQANDQSAAAQQLIDHVSSLFGIPSSGMVVGKSRVFLTDAVNTSLDQFRKLALAEPAIKIQAAWKGYRVRVQTKEALLLSRDLRPLLGVGAAAAQQGGQFLYPISVIQSVTTGSELSEYVDRAGEIIERCNMLPYEIQPATLPKAQDIFARCRKEADVIEASERLLAEESTNLAKVEATLEKANKYKFKHSSIDELQARHSMLQFEMSSLSEAQAALDSGDVESCREWVVTLQQKLDEWNIPHFSTKPLRKLHIRLNEFVSGPHEAAEAVGEDVEEPQQHFDLQQFESRVFSEEDEVRKMGTATEPDERLKHTGTRRRPSYYEEEESTEESGESSEWERSSTEYESSVEESEEEGMQKAHTGSLTKFARELKIAVAVLDAERLDLLIQRYQESGLGNRNNRDFMAATQLRGNLETPEWVSREIKESVVKVVWGTNDPSDVLRLTNLIKRVRKAQSAEALGLSDADIESGRKALICLRAAPASSAGATAGEGQQVIISKGAYDWTKYEGLTINQKKKKGGFWKRFFRTMRESPEIVCRHTFDKLKVPMTPFETKEEQLEAMRLFMVVQSYMGDRPHIARDYLAEDIINFGIERADIRDELYLQVMKQLTRNSNSTSESRGWSLMLYCCQNFAPSPTLQPYVRYFLFQRTGAAGDVGGVFDEIGETAKQALGEFDKSAARSGARQKPKRPEQDVGAVAEDEEGWNTDVMIKMMDESRQKVVIGFDSTLADVTNEICRRLNMEPSGWTVMILTEVDQNTLEVAFPIIETLGFDLLSQKIIQSTLFALWGFPQFRVLPDSQRVWDIWDPASEDFPKLVFRRRLISVSEMLYPHPNHAHLTYKQLLWEFRKYPLGDSLTTLAAVIARILVSEKWSPGVSIQERVNLPPSANALPGVSELSRSAVKAMSITYQLLEHQGYIPAVYNTQHPGYRLEWEANVQRMYQTLDSDEHQLLAINNVLMEMRRLRAFGAFTWLVVEPSEALYNSMITSSQMRAAYEGSTVDLSAGGLRRLLETNVYAADFMMGQDGYSPSYQTAYEVDTLQPMVVTPDDIARLMEELNIEREQKELEYDKGKNTNSRTGWIKCLFNILSRNKESEDDYGDFDKGEDAGTEMQQPLWMAFNSVGLHFCCAVSLGTSNRLDVKHLRVPVNQSLWIPVGVLLCVDMKDADPINPIASRWTLVCLIPLTSSVQTVVAALKAFMPGLQIYGELPAAAMQLTDEEPVAEEEVVQGEEYNGQQADQYQYEEAEYNLEGDGLPKSTVEDVYDEVENYEEQGGTGEDQNEYYEEQQNGYNQQDVYWNGKEKQDDDAVGATEETNGPYDDYNGYENGYNDDEESEQTQQYY